MADWRHNKQWWTASFLSPSWGAFYWKGDWSLSGVIWQERFLLELWESPEIFCLHLASHVEQGTADLVANIQTEIGPQKYEKSTWHQRLYIFPHVLFRLQSQFYRGFYFFSSLFKIRKKNASTHTRAFSPIRRLCKSSCASFVVLQTRSHKWGNKNKELYLSLGLWRCELLICILN